jgi:alkylation response protein AidB-like acyl-CoA dehydrogenase
VSGQRIDYYDSPEAPRANNLVPSANVVVANDLQHLSTNLDPTASAALTGLRSEVRDFLRRQRFPARIDSWLTAVDREFSKALGQRGWLGMTWAKRYGGHERTALERYVVVEELLAMGAPVAGHWFADRQVGPSLVRHGTEAQKKHFLPKIAAGECFFAIGMSEPDSGSDLASVRTRAVKSGSDWVISGTKVWTSNAHLSDYLLLLARTGPAASDDARHKNLTQIIVPLTSHGITINPIRNLDGQHHFNEVVLDEVRVPQDLTVGAVGEGWNQVTGELAFERSGPERFLSSFPLLREFARAAAMVQEDAQLVAIGRACSELMALRRLSMHVAEAIDDGQIPAVQAALVKVVGTTFESAMTQRIRDSTMDESLLGPDTALGQRLIEAELLQPGYTLRGGTNEILHGIIAKELAR